eukprot:TRINITY_DN760_c0_g2_i4.p2 TRINITY_DN760_c0_g2~~TRINITY_DN760_c0_g2_i4.p2  ORF type:complete len:115 (+),score=16.30 TRINITY_DN760_c0_g2_i4:231-575(+)
MFRTREIRVCWKSLRWSEEACFDEDSLGALPVISDLVRTVVGARLRSSGWPVAIVVVLVPQASDGRLPEVTTEAELVETLDSSIETVATTLADLLVQVRHSSEQLLVLAAAVEV